MIFKYFFEGFLGRWSQESNSICCQNRPRQLKVFLRQAHFEHPYGRFGCFLFLGSFCGFIKILSFLKKCQKMPSFFQMQFFSFFFSKIVVLPQQDAYFWEKWAFCVVVGHILSPAKTPLSRPVWLILENVSPAAAIHHVLTKMAIPCGS